MVWTSVTSVFPRSSWQYSQPVEGSVFRFKHSKAPNGNLYAVAQVQLNDDDTLDFFDSRILEVAEDGHDVVTLQKPGFFTSRRIAIKRIVALPSIEAQLRDLLIPNILKSQSEDFPPSRSKWEVNIEVSDYQPATTSNTQTSTSTGTTTQPSGSTTPTSPEKQLTYVSDGDTNGAFYFIGTNYGTQAWTNPHTANRVVITSSGSTHNHSQLVNRQTTPVFYTSNTPNSWIVTDLGVDRKLFINYLSLRHDSEVGYYLRNFKLQGSNNVTSNSAANINAATWTDLATFTNNDSINAPDDWGNFPIPNITEGYRWFRVLQNGVNAKGDNYLLLGQIELYGKLTYKV